jgi:integrase
VLHAVLAMAVERDVIGRSPCRGIKLPQVEPIRRRLPTTVQLAEVAAGMGDLGVMVWIGVATGLRWGEVAGLRVGRVDFLRGTLEVAEQVTRAKGGRATTGAPKSDAGRRTMAIPRGLLELLTDQLARRGVTGVDVDEFLFVSSKGAMLDYSHWRQRVWQPACVAAGVGAWVRADGEPWEGKADGRRRYAGLGFHDLRRVNASALVAEGVDIKTAQTRLGHSDPRLTIGLYAQALSELDVAAADRLGERLLPDRPRDERAMDAG